MRAYPEVPQWWYALMGVIAFVLGVVTIEVWDTKVYTIYFDKKRMTLTESPAASYLGVPTFPGHRHCLPRPGGDATSYY